MRQAFLSDKSFLVGDRPIPEIRDDQVLVKTLGCGICEGDLFRYSESAGSAELVPLGHEASGMVEAVGSRVKGFKAGDLVTSLQGGYAEYFCSGEDYLVKIPEGVDPGTALGEPLACCVHAAERFNIRLGDRVAVIGCGYMGMVCIQLAALQGASSITAIDLLPWRLEDAAAHGADRIVNSRDLDPENLPADLQDFDVVVEATGAVPVIKLGTKMLRNHGTLNLVGYHQSENGMRRIDMKEWNFKALTVVNSHIRDMMEKRKAMDIAMKLRAAGKLDTDFLISNYSFEDMNRAFRELTERTEGLYKANLLFNISTEAV